MTSHLALTEPEIDGWLAHVRQSALRGGLHGVRVTGPDGAEQLITITLPVTIDAAGAVSAVGGPELAESLFGHAALEPRPFDPREIVPWVRQALHNLDFERALNANPLARALDLTHFRRTDPPRIADGLALKRAIYAAADAIGEQPTPKNIELVLCFRKRFADKRSHAEIAGDLNYSAKTIQRREAELCERLAQELLRLCGQS